MNDQDIRLFEDSFGCCMSSQIGQCDCGKIYWDGYNSGYDWHEGQEQRLTEDPNATRVNWGVEYVEIFGAIYCQDCECWKGKAQQIVDWLRHYQTQVGRFYKLEKKRLLQSASEVPAVEGGE